MKRRHSDSPIRLEETVVVQINREKDLPTKKKWEMVPQTRWVQMGLFRTLCRPTVVIQREEIRAFLRIFDDEFLQQLFWKDSCYVLADKYLLAMVFEYFKRSRFTIEEYTTENFFIALFLANSMEEEDGYSMYEILFWALGHNWRQKVPDFVRQRDRLWARMNYRAVVDQRSCEEIMELIPAHFLWMRERSEHHGGARRYYDDKCYSPLGPSATPVFCPLCYATRFAENSPRSDYSSRLSQDASTD